MHKTESEVYRRAHESGIDGTVIPRYIANICIDSHRQVSGARSPPLFSIPGILMQYIPGFSLSTLFESPSPPPPQSTWKSIIDAAVRGVKSLADLDICNPDTFIRNTVAHWDPIAEKWTCKLIDFGHCVFRKKGMSDWEWTKRQTIEDEESDIGIEMEIGFERVGKKGVYRYERSGWNMALREFARENDC